MGTLNPISQGIYHVSVFHLTQVAPTSSKCVLCTHERHPHPTPPHPPGSDVEYCTVRGRDHFSQDAVEDGGLQSCLTALRAFSLSCQRGVGVCRALAQTPTPIYSDGLEDFLLVILKHLYFKFFFNLPKIFWESSKFCASMINNHRVFLASNGYIAETGVNQTHGNPPSSAGLQVTLIFATL